MRPVDAKRHDTYTDAQRLRYKKEKVMSVKQESDAMEKIQKRCKKGY